MDLGTKMKPGQSNDPRILVDPEDAWLLEYKWRVQQCGKRNVYAARWSRRDCAGKYNLLLLHRVVVGVSSGISVDHINGNGLDNRRRNLRLASVTENNRNQRLISTNTSGFKGVSRARGAKKWFTHIHHDGRNIHLGYFESVVEAALAYDKAATELYGEYALTNEMLGLYPWQKDEAADRCQR